MVKSRYVTHCYNFNLVSFFLIKKNGATSKRTIKTNEWAEQPLMLGSSGIKKLSNWFSIAGKAGEM